MDRIRNERIRGTAKMGEISKNVQERMFKWYGHFKRRDEQYVWIMMRIHVERRRRKERPKRGRMPRVNVDLMEKGRTVDDTQHRAVSNTSTHVHWQKIG